MSYNKDTDYQEKINEAVKAGDYKSAAEYEVQRNEKIDNEKLPYSKTNNYSGWLDETDYSTVIRDKISSGASRKSVSDSLKKRIEKATGTTGLSQYAYDDVYDEAIKYIMGGDNFSYKYEAEAPVYRNNYDDELDELYNRLLNMERFSYDISDDDLYKYYKEQYNREGQRAMKDLLGVLSMNTGGVASSYAVSAAGQALDEYNAKLTDKIPELYEAAYDRYIDSAENNRENLLALADASNDRYERYLDELEQYNKNREFDYRVYTDALDNEYRRQELELERENAYSEDEYLMRKLLAEENENENKRSQQALENEQEKIETALKKWEQMGYLDSESAKLLGLPAGLHTVDYDYKRSR